MEPPAKGTGTEGAKRGPPAGRLKGRSAFREVYDRHVAAVLYFLRFQVRDEDRPDVASLAFEIAARDLDSFTTPDGTDREAAERNWLLAIARNVASNWRKKHRQQEQIEIDDVRAPNDIERETAAFELANALLWTLPEHLRTLYVAHHGDSETHEELAERLALPLGTVKSQLRAAQEDLDAAIARLSARERMNRGDYLRGVMPLPFLDAAGLAQVLRSVEEEIEPDAAEYIWHASRPASPAPIASPFMPSPATHLPHAAALAGAGTAAKAAVAFTGAKVVAVAIASAFAGAALLALLRPAAPTATLPIRADVPPLLASAAAAATPTTLTVAAASSTASARALAPSAPSALASSVDVFQTEDLAMHAMRNAFASGDPAQVVNLANKHAKRYPGGMFVAERESIAIRALAQLGRMSEAKKRAESFRRAFPKSVFRSAVDAATGESSQ